MCPLELTATPAASPRCISGGSFKRFATESYGISGGDCCAIADELSSMRSPTSPRFMVISLNRGQRYCEDRYVFPPMAQVYKRVNLQHNRIVGFSRIGAAANKSENSTCATSTPSIISSPA